MPEAGHNQPPDMTVTAGEVSNDLSGWMAEHPVIRNEDEAREAKVFIDRGSLCVKDLEDERKGKTAPLNEQIETINNHYRAPRELLRGVIDELKRRFDSFLLLEERKRVVAAQEAARAAERAEQVAREAERVEQEAREDADAGVAGLDIAAVTVGADKAFADYQKAAREAQRAERETNVKVGGGFRRALSLRSKEVIVVENPIAAIQEIGLGNETILEAIIKASRSFKKLHGRYPQGVGSYSERKS